MGIIKRGTHGDIHETFEEAVAATRGAKYTRCIFHDFETGGYWVDGSVTYSMISVGKGEAFTHDPVARVNPDGTVVHLAPRMLPGDIEFSYGNVYTVYAVGDPAYKRYWHDKVQQGVRLPTFRKAMRERGYTIVRENVEKRHALARKEGGEE